MKWDKMVVLVVGNQIDTLFGVLVESNGCVVGCRVKSEGEKHISATWAMRKNFTIQISWIQNKVDG